VLKASGWLALAVGIAGCLSARVDEKTRNLNERQQESLRRLQEQQFKIQAFAQGLAPVERSEVVFGDNEVHVYLYFKPGRRLSLEERNRLNEFVSSQTGLGVDRIKLFVPKRGGG
jgi:hypothetical protein